MLKDVREYNLNHFILNKYPEKSSTEIIHRKASANVCLVRRPSQYKQFTWGLLPHASESLKLHAAGGQTNYR